MNRNVFICGAMSIVLAAILFALDVTRIVLPLGNGSLTFYPAGFYGLLGLFLIYRSIKPLWQA